MITLYHGSYIQVVKPIVDKFLSFISSEQIEKED